MLKVAGLPWDPPPAKPEPMLHSNVKQHPDRHSSNSNMNPPQSQGNLNTLPPIKPEITSYPPQPVPQSYPAPQFPQGQALTAQQRAARNLHQTFGDRAGAQIAELQQSNQRHPSMAQQMPQGPYIKQEEHKPNLPSMDNYRHNVVQQSSPPIKTDQTDGAGDDRDEWDAEYARRKEAIRQGRGGSDRLIRDHVLASQQELQAGGLMMPLIGRPRNPQNHIIKGESSTAGKKSSLSRAQGDAAGDDDDDEEDENAINSDLDDPEDAADDIEGNETIGNVMLCTYDKVQRVKNKWKCTLKDGILGIDGQE
jgi:transcription initiation factor TFIIA large subunit